MEEKRKYPNIKELEKEEHDILTSCSLSYSSSGMMYNSNTSDYTFIERKGDEQIITHTVKPAFQGETKKVYRAATDVLAEVKALVDKHNMGAWSQLEYVQEYVVYDYSSSAGMALYFDDRALGGTPYETKHINIQAVRQQGAGDIVDEYRKILEDAEAKAELIEEIAGENKSSPMMGLMGMGMVPQPQAGCWVCPECNYNKNSGKFCCECGRKKPE